MIGARILVLEDDPQWLNTLHDVLDPVADQVSDATTLRAARNLITRCYFNVAVVDWSLRLNDPIDNQGMQFLQALRELHLDQTVRCIVVSAYGTIERTRIAFHDFNAVDFLEKASFQAEELVDAVERALVRNNLNRNVEMEVAGGGSLRRLCEQFDWVQDEDPFQLELELLHLFLRLFPDADRLFIQALPFVTAQAGIQRADRSGTGVLEVEPYYGVEVGTPAVVKFGEASRIRQEIEKYADPTETGAPDDYAFGRVMGALRWLIGLYWQTV